MQIADLNSYSVSVLVGETVYGRAERSLSVLLGAQSVTAPGGILVVIITPVTDGELLRRLPPLL